MKNTPVAPGENHSPVASALGEQKTRKALSSLRLKVAFMLFVSVLLLGVCGLLLGRAAQLLGAQTPAIQAELNQQLLWTAAIGCGVGLLASLLFIRLYLGPRVRSTENAFARLEQTTSEALEAARLKSEFLANMSHEIRTPMNGVLGMLELLRSTSLDAKQKRYTNTLSTSANGLMTVLNDILDFSKIEAGKVELRPGPCQPRALLEEVAELFAARAELKQLELMCHVHPDVPTHIEVDADRLRQVVTNLVGNALKFTDVGEVVVQASVAERRGDQCLLELCVIDTGIGIDPTQQALLFEAFAQVEGSATCRVGGTGLGLTISRELVRLMGGELGVQSELGQGSQFSARLPVRVLPATAPQLPAPNRNARALIVDDNATHRVLLEQLLSTWGLRTASANGGEAALRLLDEADESDPFALVITDMHMPVMDGLTFSREVKHKHAHLPLLLLTSLSDTGSAIADRRLFSGVLSKPVRSAELESSVARALGESGRGATSDAEATSIVIAAHEPRRLLIAEDNPINQEVLLGALQNLGYAADVVNNGRLAVEAWQRNVYPLILMDCQMPVLDGHEAARQIRQLENDGERVAIIAVTAHALAGEREKALAAGMDDYVTKPLNTRLLREALERWWPRESMWPCQPTGLSIPAPPLAPSNSALDPTVDRTPGIARVFLRHVPDQLTLLASALSSNDHEGLRAAAHKLKGSCLSVGVPRMAALCARLEAAPEAANARDLKSQLDAEFVRASEALSELLPLKSA